MLDLRNFRHVALIEATTFLLLLVASYLKHFHDEPLGVSILGPIHGFFFVVYFVMVLYLREEQGWNLKTTLLILLGAVLPFGGYVVDRRLEDEERAGTA
jgi:integral membrane protein